MSVGSILNPINTSFPPASQPLVPQAYSGRQPPSMNHQVHVPYQRELRAAPILQPIDPANQQPQATFKAKVQIAPAAATLQPQLDTLPGMNFVEFCRILKSGL